MNRIRMFFCDRIVLILSLWLVSGAASTKGSFAQESSVKSFDQSGELLGLNVCTSSERWIWPKNSAISAEVIKEFTLSISNGASRIRGFSEALALRRLADSDQSKAFAEYWMARSLYTAGLFHIAEKGFSALLAREVSDEISSIQLAALGCLSSIHKKVPGIQIEKKFIKRLIKLNEMIPKMSATAQPLKSVVWEAAFYLFLEDTSYPVEVLNLMKGSGPFEALSLASIHSHQDRFEEVLRDLDLFFLQSKGIDLFKVYQERAHLLYGRAAYALGKYPDSVRHYQAIKANSNEWVHALSELSWAYLMEEKYREAIGVAIGLQSGGLRRTFGPEALMVMAMALNEMCRFPESMSVIQAFRKNYRDSYFWLKADSSSPGKYYKDAIDFAKRVPISKVPPQIASEWIRSSVFQSNQDRINLLFQERERTNRLSQQGKLEQRAMALKLLEDIKKIRKKMKTEMIKSKPGESLSNQLLSELARLKMELQHYRHFQTAAPIWRKVLSAHETRVPGVQQEMILGINQEIGRLNERMLAQLNEISENNELIEVEILNGASEDLIWQNAHPGYKEAAKKMKGGSHTQADQVWDWGSTQGGLDGRGEIWEDEIGSLRADMYDNCESKDKYLAVRQAEAK